MANEIAKRDDYSVLDAEIGSSIDGEPLRFKDGNFIRGFDKTQLKLGVQMAMHPASVSDGFIKWEDGRPVEFASLTTRRSHRSCARHLAITTERAWPDGKDPWSYVMMIALKDSDGVPLTFTTGTVGGKNALRKVLRDWRLARSRYPSKVPVVELGVDSYDHKVHRTTVTIPVFKIIGWGDWDNAEGLTLADEVKPNLSKELNDDLPDWA